MNENNYPKMERITSYNPITNPIPNITQNPYILRQKQRAISELESVQLRSKSSQESPNKK